MNIIDHIFEPSRLYLVWHCTTEGNPHHRRIVGELFKDNDSVSFRYLKDTADYVLAEKEGFIGFPAFTMRGNEKFENAIGVFLTRLPPRKRADFSKYLAQYALPSDFSGTDLALLGYTGARLASDSFELCPDFSDVLHPVDLVLEVSGTQYNMAESMVLTENEPVQFETEPENEHDSNAVAIHAQGGKLGYVSRAMNKSFKLLMDRCTVTGSVLKFNHQQHRLQVMVLANCR